MNFFNLKTFGGIALFGIIASCWSKIKFFFDKIVSLIIIKVKINNNIENALHYYCKHNFKKFRLNSYNFVTMRLRSKIFKRYIEIPRESHEEACLIYFDGWKPIFLNSFNIISNNSSAEKSFIIFRGMFDIKKLISNSMYFFENKITEYNKNEYGKNKRFYIYEKIGVKHATSEGKPIEVVSEEGMLFKMGFYETFWHEPDQIGYEKKSKNKLIDDLYFEDKVINDISQDLEYWLNNEEWYRDKGIPWKRGTMLFGKPGTGKTSLVRAFGEKYDLPIISFHIHTLSNTELIDAWNESISNYPPCIFLIEDIDNIFHGREKAQTDMMNDKVTFDCLLNVLDGANKEDGYYLFMTTNKIDQIDEALGIPRNGNNEFTISTRPGRIDRVIELNNINDDNRLKMANRIMDDIASKELIEKTINNGYNDTPAQFLERCRGIAVGLHIKKNLLET